MKLIINADDFGISQSANESIIELANLGSLSSTTVMTNMPYADGVVDLLPIKSLGIGIHINLTQGKPISNPSDIPSLVDKEGNFLEKPGFTKAVKAGLVKKEEVKKEITAQFNWLYDKIGERLDHIDSHQGTNKLSIVTEVLMELADELPYKLGIRVYNKYYLSNHTSKAIDRPSITNITRFGVKRILVETFLNIRTKKIGKSFFHPDGLLLSRTHRALDSFEKLIDLQHNKNFPDKVLEIAFHPAKDTKGLPKTKLLEERILEHKLLSSQTFIESIKNYSLINYADLRKA